MKPLYKVLKKLQALFSTVANILILVSLLVF